jgi:hypothetical protein
VIALRPVESEADVQSWLAVRARVDPDHPITRANFNDGREKPDRLDLLADLGDEPVGAAWANLPSGGASASAATSS